MSICRVNPLPVEQAWSSCLCCTYKQRVKLNDTSGVEPVQVWAAGPQEVLVGWLKQGVVRINAFCGQGRPTVCFTHHPVACQVC